MSRAVVFDHAVYAIVKYNGEDLVVASLWATKESADEQLSVERDRNGLTEMDDPYRVAQLVVDRRIEIL